MKRSFSRIVAIVAQLWAALVALAGCGGPEKPLPPKVSWKGEDTAYQNTTPDAPKHGENPAPQSKTP
jgi:hypothetical protein